MSIRVVIPMVLALACTPKPAPPSGGDGAVVHPARDGVSDGPFADLLVEHWEASLRHSPSSATYMGDHRFDDLLDDVSLDAHRAWNKELAEFLARADRLEGASLATDRERMHLRLFTEALRDDMKRASCRFPEWSFSPRFNPMVDLFSLLDMQPVGDDEAIGKLQKRLEAFPRQVDDTVANLRSGLESGLVASTKSTELVIEQMDRQLSQATADWPMLGRIPEAHRDGVSEALDQHVRPALVALKQVLVTELLPNTRSDASPGVAGMNLPGCYASLAAHHTTTTYTPDEIHQMGLEALEGIHQEFLALGPTTLGEETLPGIFDALRTKPELRFETREQLLEKAEEALRRAEQVVPGAFGRLPATPCVIAEIPAHEAPYTTVAYYRQPSPDGEKPGEYFVNTHAPETRPRHEAEVLAFHESVPGHHLQIALSYELPSVPAFLRYRGATAFVEGWALYTERLADELGLYTGDLDRLGMLSFDAWRASRLVVDSGLHHKAWSRQQAIDFMVQNTPLAENNIFNEVDRYVTWPGQALGYKVGQIEIWKLRRETEARLGDRFDLAGFHDVVLGQGAVSLPVLRDAVERWEP
ncbi:MAG: DUF885 domain-containing protein [Myxococcota bacterium]